MAVTIRMPQPGQMTEECTVLQWFKQEGDPVRRGDPLFEIETDKSNMEIEAFDEGTLLRVDAPEGATVPVDTVVAWIGTPGEKLPAATESALLPRYASVLLDTVAVAWTPLTEPKPTVMPFVVASAWSSAFASRPRLPASTSAPSPA